MRNMHYDAVIVGSGFGGSVMAYRLAEAGLHVCLLERGKAYPPGSFARTPYQMKHNFWDPSNGSYGLYNAWSFPRLTAAVSSGLGGGSLIYSNVMIRKEEKWFVKEDPTTTNYENWPVTRADLDLHYDRVEKMLHVQQYPLAHPPYNGSGRPLALKDAAERLHLNWYLPPLAVTFANEGAQPFPGLPIPEILPNIHGANSVRTTCRLCGECNFGCNFGSKNSLDYTYLTEASRLGAEIFPLCEVRSFQPSDDGYTISYVEHDPAMEGQPQDTHNPTILPLKTITANRLILSAGTLGTTFLLLKNIDAFPHLSRMLGSHFSGNGDFIASATRCRENVNGEQVQRIIEATYGPAITSTIRIPDTLDTGEGQTRGFYIQDAGYPNFINWMLQILSIPSSFGEWFSLGGHLIKGWLEDEVETDVGGYLAQLLGSSDASTCSLPMGGMGRDYPTGVMKLHDGKLSVDSNDHLSDGYYARVRQQMKDISDALEGKLTDDPLWLLNRLVTVHPLGGCPMGSTISEGVVNPHGEVFNYPNLYIADGSVMPGPVGANPSLTIAALSDHTADTIIDTYRPRT
ncbi:MAG: GMC family oxidoreductase [Ktedonobacteraceae bacterium]|nr:GMC family oxidoreductase [Ktedonobacteraceae bacterium]